MNALFIGRFQPFHLGHLSVVKKALQENDYLFIAIGSSEESFLPDNPFTAGERFQMIQAALDEAEIDRSKYTILPIRNINNYALWPKHVALHLPPFEKIYTGSTIVQSLFEAENLTLKNPYKIIFVKKELKISGTQVRKLMLENKKWEALVPKSVATLINRR